jgi:hypothetical protein
MMYIVNVHHQYRRCLIIRCHREGQSLSRLSLLMIYPTPGAGELRGMFAKLPTQP